MTPAHDWVLSILHTNNKLFHSLDLKSAAFYTQRQNNGYTFGSLYTKFKFDIACIHVSDDTSDVNIQFNPTSTVTCHPAVQTWHVLSNARWSSWRGRRHTKCFMNINFCARYITIILAQPTVHSKVSTPTKQCTKKMVPWHLLPIQRNASKKKNEKESWTQWSA